MPASLLSVFSRMLKLLRQTVRPARLNVASLVIDVSELSERPTGESVMLNVGLVRVALVRIQGFAAGLPGYPSAR